MTDVSPCKHQCRIKEGVCLGCGRSIDEIVEAGKKYMAGLQTPTDKSVERLASAEE